MKKRRSPFLLAGIVVAAAIVSVLSIEARGVSEGPEEPDKVRHDVLIIDTLAAYGELEEHAVEFHHDKHTEALAKQDKDCKACHLADPEKGDRLSIKFKRIKETSASKIKSIYHENCIGCHQERADEGKETGPLDGSCRSCHAKEPKVVFERAAMGFDLSLHARHTKDQQGKKKTEETCGRCHHEYNKKLDKLVYVKDEEGTCRYCHMEEATKDVRSLRAAAHESCVSCHLETREKEKDKKDIGPVTCAGCHSPKKQEEIKELKEIPRMDRNQPNLVMINVSPDDPALKGVEEGEVPLMAPVAFNHKAHEEYNDTCRVCHHAAMKSCSEGCHTLQGTEEGDFIPLGQSMHQVDSMQSCLGCHNQEKKDKNCAGCHTFMGKKPMQEATCAQCHQDVKQLGLTIEAECCDQEGLVSAEAKKEARECCEAQTAEAILEARPEVTGTYKDEDIPEKVVIKVIADEYQPAEFPHRKIVKKLVENMKDNKLAASFHSSKGTICQGCHHNSPEAKKPPRCASCHGKPFDDKDLFRPGLKAAYHGQCIECHEAMNLEKPKATACAECHKEKKKQ